MKRPICSVTLALLLTLALALPLHAFPQGKLQTKIDVDDVTIVVDGVTQGSGTFLSQPLDAGPHEVQVLQRGELLWKGTVTINEGETTEVDASAKPYTFFLREPLRPGAGILEVDFVNPKAMIYVDKLFVGEQHVVIAQIPEGPHTVIVLVDSVPIWAGTLRIHEKAVTTVSGEKTLLEPAPVYKRWSDQFISRPIIDLGVGVRILPEGDFQQLTRSVNAQTGTALAMNQAVTYGGSFWYGAFPNLLIGTNIVNGTAASDSTSGGTRWDLVMRTQEAAILAKTTVADFPNGAISLGGGAYFVQATVTSTINPARPAVLANSTYSGNVLGFGFITDATVNLTPSVLLSLETSYRIARIPELKDNSGALLTNSQTGQTVSLDLGGFNISGQVGWIF